MDIEKQMQEEINRQRWIHNREGYRPGDKGYLPPATEFITIRFRNGMIVMPADDFRRLPKTKQKKLMRW